MHRRLGSATLSQLAFPGERNPNFPWEKSHWDNTVVQLYGERTCVRLHNVTKSMNTWRPNCPRLQSMTKGTKLCVGFEHDKKYEQISLTVRSHRE